MHLSNKLHFYTVNEGLVLYVHVTVLCIWQSIRKSTYIWFYQNNHIVPYYRLRLQTTDTKLY